MKILNMLHHATPGCTVKLSWVVTLTKKLVQLAAFRILIFLPSNKKLSFLPSKNSPRFHMQRIFHGPRFLGNLKIGKRQKPGKLVIKWTDNYHSRSFFLFAKKKFEKKKSHNFHVYKSNHFF